MNDDLFAFMRLVTRQIHEARSVNHMFGTAIRRFTAVMFKNSSNNSYSN